MELNKDEVARYSRQLLMPEIGKEGQLKLKSTKVLIVGCGGLGCPSGLYLAAAGIGTIGLLDDDVVETNNLHRQVLHRESTIGTPKTQSAAAALRGLNSNVTCVCHQSRLTRENALDIVKDYDIVIDATDNAMTRYLLSDVCVLLNKPMVSGSALRFEGQLTVYNFNDENISSPCYRCLFPKPPPAGTVTNCSDGGVLGVVPGIIGSMQALETLKIALGMRPNFTGKMYLFDGLSGIVRTIQLRPRQSNCVSCGPNATITKDLINYQEFCGVVNCAEKSATLKILAPEERMSAQEYKEKVLDTGVDHLLVDVRSKLQADITKLPNAVNIPLDDLQTENGLERLKKFIEESNAKRLYFMCRRGNASQKAVRLIKEKTNLDKEVEDLRDIIGGLEYWAREIDPEFPMY